VTEVFNSATKRKSMTRVFEKIVFQMPLLRKAPPRSTAMWFLPFSGLPESSTPPLSVAKSHCA